MDPHEFGPRLKAEREQRGISLDALAAATKVSVDLWQAMEKNDFSRWPSGIFARAFVRDYARTVGLDADAVVNDFCRSFSVGDRRATRIVQAQAELIGHRPEGLDGDPLPAGRERRQPRRAAQTHSSNRALYAPRIAAATFDVLAVAGLAIVGVTMFRAGFLASAGVFGLIYFTAGTIGVGGSPGVRVMEAVRQRAPSLFPDRRAVRA